MVETTKNNILGISAYYHDAAAAVLRDGELVAAAQEERFTRKKHDARFPRHAIDYCLDEGGLEIGDIDSIVFYDKPLIKFERLLETYLSYAPGGFRSFVAAMPIWFKEKLFLKTTLKRELANRGNCKIDALPPLFFAEHHHSHAASAFFFSPFEKAAVLCLDGVGEWATTSTWVGDGKELKPLWEIDFPHSLNGVDKMHSAYLGPRFSADEIRQQLDAHDADYLELDDSALFSTVAEQLDNGDIVGWLQGRMEFGPRALGGRSIIGDARNEKTQQVMNRKIKYRESFRPFAPSVLAERVSDYFEQQSPSPYMLIVAPVLEKLRLPVTEEQSRLFGI